MSVFKKFQRIAKLALVLPLAMCLSSCSNPVEDQLSLPKSGDQIAIIKTNFGDIKVKFFPKLAPKAVENFISLSKSGYYNDILFHRVIKGFVIQSGDPDGTGYGGESSFGEPFKDELTPDLHHFRGALSMANRGRDTNTSQFFIVQSNTVDEEKVNKSGILVDKDQKPFTKSVSSKYFEIGGAIHLDGLHTIFGQVFEGLDVVDKINSLTVNSKGLTIEPATIKSVEITTYK